MKQVFKTELLQSVADMIKAAGMKVYISNWSNSSANPTYFHFTDGDKIGYCQESPYFGGIQFSTVHKPCRECGTGFGLSDDKAGLDAKFNPSIENAKRAFIHAPNWATRTDYEAVKKYANWDEFTKRNTGPDSYTEY